MATAQPPLASAAQRLAMSHGLVRWSAVIGVCLVVTLAAQDGGAPTASIIAGAVGLVVAARVGTLLLLLRRRAALVR